MDEITDTIKKSVKNVYLESKKLQEAIHQNPELSNMEIQTRNKIKTFLDGTSVEIRECKQSLGFICDLKLNKNFPTIAFRADMDALPINERTDLPYRSKNDNIMHACGHDFHSAILAGAAKALSLLSGRLSVNLRFIFQPAEEDNPIGGAKRIIREGGLADCAAVLGLHLWPGFLTGQAGTKPGPLFASSDRLTLRIIGKSAHAAMPEAGVDSIVIAGHVLLALQSAISRGLSPFDEAVLTIGRIEGGTRYNVLAEETRLLGTVRNTSSAAREKLRQSIINITGKTAEMFGGKGEVEYFDGYPVLENNFTLFESASAILQKLSDLGMEFIELKRPSMISEDFSYYTHEIPGLFFFLGCTEPGTKEEDIHPLHSPLFKADQNCIRFGLAALIGMALNANEMLTRL